MIVRRRQSFWAFALCALSPTCAAAAQVRITEYGEYVFRSERPSDEPSEVTGNNVVDEPRFVNRASDVPAQFCVHFGIQYEAVPPLERPVLVTVRLMHPMMVNPDGRRGTVETKTRLLTEGSTMTGFGFDYEWEIVPGDWTFAILQGETVLAEHTFHVVGQPGGFGSRDCSRPTS